MKSLLSLLLFLAMPVCAGPFIVAHRGASGEAPENTLPAFRLAWEQEADAIEGDFHLTSDGKIVCFHDSNTKKLTGRNLTLSKSTFAELQDLDAGSWKGQKFSGTRIPSLKEVLATVPPKKKIYIEIKCGPEIVPPLLKVVAASGLADEQIVVISFDEKVVKGVKKERPDWTVNWLYGFDKGTGNAPGRELPRLLSVLKTIRADGLGSSAHPDLRSKHLQTLSGAGFQHHVWTVNDPAVARRFLKLGCRSITTDFPGRLRRELEK
ncbi:MAG: glycerophosphodiester phosphodiesterase [Verrucomicrobiota bacterium]|nr:glycerophosphodiester phosphodiesterase [Verrucomicrobiota bacterium]